jgi:hypothetical protein
MFKMAAGYPSAISVHICQSINYYNTKDHIVNMQNGAKLIWDLAITVLSLATELLHHSVCLAPWGFKNIM